MQLDIAPRIGCRHALLSQELKELPQRINLARDVGIPGTAFLESPQVDGLIFPELGPIEGAFYERYFNSRLAKPPGCRRNRSSNEPLTSGVIVCDCSRHSFLSEIAILKGMAKTTRTFWVIFAGPEQTGKPGTRYIASDGTVTKQKQLAAKFVTYGDAEKFAQSKNIRLDGTTRHIGHDDFEDSDI